MNSASGGFFRLLGVAAGLFVSLTAPAVGQTLPQGALTVMHQITGSDGAAPVGRLVQGSDGALYGVLFAGGTYLQGSVFKITPAGAFSTLFSFGSADSSSPAPTGTSPNSGVVFGADGNLYGTTSLAGPNTGGTVFRMTPTGDMTTLLSLGGTQTAPTNPSGALFLASDGNFYGTTGGGIATVFRMTPAGEMTILHSFASDGSEGDGFYSSLVEGSDGALYGVTSGVGGTVFRVDMGGAFSTLHVFPSLSQPVDRLVLAADGSLYGVTMAGGVGEGTIFQITNDGSFSSLHSFACDCGPPDDGGGPPGSLTLGSDGRFYGVTSRGGGSANLGTIFAMSNDGTTLTLHSFTADEGGPPVSGLVEGADGRFYGMTSGQFASYAAVYKFAVPPLPPAQPSAVAATGGVTLSWSKVRSANSYDVYQGTAPGAEGSMPVLSDVTATTATIAGEYGTTYYYRIVAVNEAGSSPASSEISAEPLASAARGGGGGQTDIAILLLLAACASSRLRTRNQCEGRENV